MPSNEAEAARSRIDEIAAHIAAQVDLDQLLAISRQAAPLQGGEPAPDAAGGPPVRIGIARDAAFGFYYPGDLDALRSAGAELVSFDALHAEHLPKVDGLFIGGGFPETHMEALAANTSLRRELHDAIEGGLPAYAECGGLMYLARGIEWNGRARRWSA